MKRSMAAIMVGATLAMVLNLASAAAQPLQEVTIGLGSRSLAGG